MKCPIDKTEMEKGYIQSGSISPLYQKAAWRMDPEKFLTLKCPKIINMLAYHCQKCGKVELTTEV